ncbi:MAG: phosphoribosylformylglycinamidine synthase I [Nitrososphaerota archaeon]|jgi:phosphoribosylformylglycinamidine synthase|nr:phosphoribosylformylglycinamidine synthase I [Nitrososphaerota archaeon]
MEKNFKRGGLKMKTEEIKVCVLRVGGTNCDFETARAFQELGVQAEIKHVNELVKHGNLLSYNMLVFPGGFSFGDYVRSGVIFARSLNAKLGKQMKQFIDENRPILGICNGFQILVEYGLLPGFEDVDPYSQAVLTTNNHQGFKCKWVYLKNENKGNCLFTNNIPQNKILKIPIAHGEGRFLFPVEKEKQLLEKLVDNDMLVFRYCDENGTSANSSYPINPNGAYHDIAGICNTEGTIFGLMPHPERAMHWWQEPDWTSKIHTTHYGDGKLLFENILTNIRKIQ